LKMQFHGGGTLTYGANGELATVSGEVAASRLAFDAPGIFAHPVSFSSLDLSGTYTMGVHKLEIAKLALAAPSLTLQASGIATFDTVKSPGLVMTGTIGALPVSTLLAYWPSFA